MELLRTIAKLFCQELKLVYDANILLAVILCKMLDAYIEVFVITSHL